MEKMYRLLLALAACFIGTGARGYIPIWLSKELKLLKADAQANVKSSQFILDRIENSIVRTKYMNEFQTPHNPPLKPIATGGNYPRNCKEAYKHGYTSSAWRTIDPDGQRGAIKPFPVKCQRSGDHVMTEFGFTDTYWSQQFSGPQECFNHRDLGVPGAADYCAKTKTVVPYVLTWEQMMSAVHASGNCSQSIEWSCHANSLLYLHPGSRSKKLAFGKSLTHFKHFDQGYCECNKGNKCTRVNTVCNCGMKSLSSWQRDHIVLEGNRNLPVTEILLGDLSGSREKAQIVVSNVKCWM